MEHSVVNVADLRGIALENLTRTYIELGLASAGSRLVEDPGFLACVGISTHPISNFAIQKHLDPWSARKLASIASERPAFHLYCLPEGDVSTQDDLLWRADFQRIYELEVLASEQNLETSIDLLPAESGHGRRMVAQFMTDQFFGRQSIAFRRQVSEATTNASRLQLFYLEERSRPIASVMISRSEGALGIYNLCVSPAKRGRGLGAELTKWCLNLAAKEHLLATLQCDPPLIPWYDQLGFRSLGRIRVFSLLKQESVPIIEAGSLLQRA